MFGTTTTAAIVCVTDHALPRLSVTLHRGPAGSVLVAGTPRWCRYYPELFFTGEEHSRESLGTWPVWRLPALLERWRPRVDLLIARVDRFSAARFAADRFVRVPEWVRMVAQVPRDVARLPSSQARSNERLARRHGLCWRVSHDRRDLTTFIERDYEPYTRNRFGEDAVLRPSRWFHDRFQNGGLVWIERNHETIAGMAYDIQGRSLRRLAVACARGNVASLRTGAMSATFLACFDLARQERCDVVDFRNSRPSVTDGLLQAKSSWGGRIVEPDDITHDVLVGWHTATPSVTDFLARSPLVVRHGQRFAVVRSVTTGSRQYRIPRGVDHVLAPPPGAAFGDWNILAVPS